MTTPMFGGDEVNAIVIDVGSLQCKAGYAGEDTPKAVFDTVCGELPEGKRGHISMDEDSLPSTSNENVRDQGKADARVRSWRKRGLRVLQSAHTRPLDHQEVLQTYQSGLVTDWDPWKAVVDEAFGNRLRTVPSDHPLLMAEPTFATKDMREKMVESLFEDFGVPALFLAKNAVLSSFALGRQTSLVIDLGHEGSVVSAVHDGYVLNTSVMRSPVGGRLMSDCLLKGLTAEGAAIHPRYLYDTIAKPGANPSESVLGSFPHITKSHIEWATRHVVSDIKETVCRVAENPFLPEEHLHMPAQTYELPDGTSIDIGIERFKVPEILFNPSLIKTYKGIKTLANYDGTALKSLQEMVIDSVNLTDPDVRRDLFGGVVLTGGSSLFVSMKERLDKELMDLVPQAARVKVTTHQNLVERKFSVWLGGSILGSLGSFHQLWMSKQEYEEHGAALIHRKCP